MHDPKKIEEAVLALLGVFQFDHGRCWKSYDWDVMNALHAQGWITDPHSSAKSGYLTPEGQERAKALAAQLFDPELP